MNRRTFLGAVVGGSVGLAGCLGDGSGSENDRMRLDDHPAAAGLDGQPILGPAPSEARGVIIAFEDPSCPTCRRFEQNTFPTLESELIDPGTAAFAYRVLPVVYPWGKPAVQALEATFVHDEAAFWELKAHYYATQDAFTTENVLPRTESFLAANTDVDAKTVVAEAREKRYDDAVQADVTAAGNAGASATPTFFVFRDGRFVTSATGAKSATVFKTALGL